MSKRNRSRYAVTAALFLGFVIFTLMTRYTDVRPIGPGGSRVGLAALNRFVFDRLGVHLFWYTLTDWLGLVPVLAAFGFAVLGLCQLIKRRSLWRVDPDILALGVFYLAVIGCYVLFEKVVINYRPVLMNGHLEASYPSSHTMVMICVMTTAMTRFNRRVRNRPLLLTIDILSVLIIAVTIAGRLISGAHWFTDIAGGAILSAALSMLYCSARASLCAASRVPDMAIGD